MLNRKIHPDTWQVFFDNLSKDLKASGQEKYVLLRLVIPGLTGTQDMAHGLSLIGITYEAKAKVLFVFLDGLTHQVDQPDVVWASVDRAGNFDAFVVLCHDGSKVTIDLSTHRFPYDARVYRPARRNWFLRQDKAKEQDSHLGFLSLRKWGKRAADPGEQRSARNRKPKSFRASRPRVHRQDADRAMSGNATNARS